MPAFRRQSFTVLKSSFHKACHKPNLYEAATIREKKETTTRSWSSKQTTCAMCDATRRPRRRRTTHWLRRDRRDGFTPDVKGLLKGLEEMSGALRPSQAKAN